MATRAKTAAAGGALGFLLAAALLGWRAGQEAAPVGYLSKDRVYSLAAAADGAFASFSPSSDALASLAVLVDPVHVRVFLLASRPEDLKFAGAIGRAFDAAGNPALSAEFIGVAKDLSEPASIIADNGVTQAPEAVIFWLGVEVGRLHPQPGAAAEDDLVALVQLARAQIAQEMLQDNEFFRNTFHSDLPLDCTRCHLAPGSGE